MTKKNWVTNNWLTNKWVSVAIWLIVAAEIGYTAGRYNPMEPCPTVCPACPQLECGTCLTPQEMTYQKCCDGKACSDTYYTPADNLCHLTLCEQWSGKGCTYEGS